MSKRFAVFDRRDMPLFDLSLDAMSGEGAKRYERLGGEHKLDIVTYQRLDEGLRILSQDGTGKWREWAVDEPDEAHDGADLLLSYGCTWSMQYDLATVSGGELWPGTYSPITAGAALAMVLGVQSRWEVGNVTVAGTAGTTLYDGQVWDYLGKLQDVWGGEMEPRIEVGANGVTHRYVDWLAHVGRTEANRRFDYGEDCTSIHRKEPPGPRYCRVEPRGGKDATDNDGVSYSERVGVEEEPADSGDGWAHDANSKYVRDPDAEEDFKQPDGNGGWHYPTKVVTYDTDDPEELLQLAAADIHKYTRPSPTYEADVLQFAAAGMDAHGVELGDEVQIVDRKFGDSPLRLEARIVEMTVNELDETDVQLVIGEASKGLESAFKSMRSAIDAAEERSRRIEGGGTIVYLQHLLDEINAEINGMGGYSYVVADEGIITYDIAVDDPLIGYNSATRTWASRVTQVKGGSIRFAKEKNAGFVGINDWKWTNVITPDGYLGLAATIARITTGWLGNANGTFIDLESNTANFGPTDGYHFTVDTNGIQHWYGNTLLGQYLSSSMQLGKSNSSHVIVNTSGMEVYNASNASVLYAGTSGNESIVRVGKASDSGNVVASSAGYVDVRNASTVLAHFGYASGINQDGLTSVAPYYDVGVRKASTTIGNYSVAMGFENGVSGYCSAAIGRGNVVSGSKSLAIGGGYSYESNTVSGQGSLSVGKGNTLTGSSSICVGRSNTLSKESMAMIGVGLSDNNNSSSGLICGTFNSSSIAYGTSFIVGVGKQSSRHTALSVGGDGSDDGWVRIHKLLNVDGRATFDGIVQLDEDCYHYGNVYVNNTLVHSSDRRLKNHIAYLDDDAVEFVRALRPVRFKWKRGGGEHYGFYAQDVQAADHNNTETVIEGEMDEKRGFAPLSIDYTAIIAPLVAYAQSLEKRIDRQQKQIDALTARLEALEAGR